MHVVEASLDEGRLGENCVFADCLGLIKIDAFVVLYVCLKRYDFYADAEIHIRFEFY